MSGGITVDGLTATLPSSKSSQCYFFAEKKYVLLRYTVGSEDDVILEGPSLITDWIPDLAGTNFANQIDCAFGTDSTHAFIFSGNQCAQINYIDAELFQRPDPISDVFPKLAGTVFAQGLDAAINSANADEVFIFKNDQCASLNYVTKNFVMESTAISTVFPSLTPTIFKYRLDAAFATDQQGNQAYIFQGEYYLRFDFTQGADKLINDQELPILQYWPVLRALFPSNE